MAIDLELFVRGYVEAALWTEPVSRDGDDTSLQANYTPDDIHPDSLAVMRRDCEDFVTAERARLERAAGSRVGEVPYGGSEFSSQAGHDFWLTRNHHGVGFWDRGLGEVGDELTTAANSYGEQSLYLEDDGLIYTG